MKSIYIDALHGASGDMLLSSLLDLGLQVSFLENLTKKLGVDNLIDLKVTDSKRNGISGTHLDVIIESSESHNYRWQDFVEIVKRSDFSDYVKTTTSNIFNLIGQAESEVHGIDINQVEFHELGTLDTLFDVVGVISAIEELDIDKIYCSSLPRGSGTVNTAHGILPVPPPATVKILEITQAPSFSPTNSMIATGEMITPTGAAILSTISDFDSPTMKIYKSGCGLGTRNPDSYPNVTRVHIGSVLDAYSKNHSSTELLLLETNIDDTSGEILGYVLEKLLDMGAKDVWHTPIQMKKNRPAILLSVLIDKNCFADISEFMFRETSTLGIRVRDIYRVEAERRIEKFESTLGKVNIKIKILDGLFVGAYPEYEDCKAIAISSRISLFEVYNTLQAEIRDKFLNNIQ